MFITKRKHQEEIITYTNEILRLQMRVLELQHLEKITECKTTGSYCKGCKHVVETKYQASDDEIGLDYETWLTRIYCAKQIQCKEFERKDDEQ